MSQTQSLPLRGHHFLCLLTYVGEGYSPAFVACFTKMASALTHGAVARIVLGDDPLCYDESINHCCPKRWTPQCIPADMLAKDALALADLRRIVPQDHGWQAGNLVVFTPPLVATLRDAFAKGAIRKACTHCPWWRFCTETADKNYAQTLFFPVYTGILKKGPHACLIPCS